MDERATIGWASAQLPVARWMTAHLHAGYAHGHVRKESPGLPAPYIDEDRWVRLGGASIELHRRRR